MYSYAPEEDCMVTDPKLAEHLAHWGIDAMKYVRVLAACLGFMRGGRLACLSLAGRPSLIYHGRTTH